MTYNVFSGTLNPTHFTSLNHIHSPAVSHRPHLGVAGGTAGGSVELSVIPYAKNCFNSLNSSYQQTIGNFLLRAPLPVSLQYNITACTLAMPIGRPSAHGNDRAPLPLPHLALCHVLLAVHCISFASGKSPLIEFPYLGLPIFHCAIPVRSV